MFGSNNYTKMVEKNQWDKLTAKLSNANTATKLEIAEACSQSSEDESMNILVRLLQDTDEKVQLQAIKSLGVSGRSSIKSHLAWLSQHLPATGKDEIKAAIRESLAAISKRG